MTSKCPVKVKQAAFVIEGSNTEFLVADYGTDCFVQISQVSIFVKIRNNCIIQHQYQIKI